MKGKSKNFIEIFRNLTIFILIIAVFYIGWPQLWAQHFFPPEIQEAKAATCNAASSGNWNTIGTWSCGNVPTASDDVTIATGATVTMDLASGAVANSLSITGTLAFAATTYTLTVGTGGVTINSGGNITGTSAAIITTSGNLTDNSTSITTSTVSITMTGASTTITGTGTVPFLTINNSVTNNGNLTVSTKLAGSSTLTNGTNANLYLQTTPANYTLTTLDANSNSGNTVTYNSTTVAQNILAINYQNLSCAKGGLTGTMVGDTVVNGNLTITSGTFQISTFNFTVNGTASVSGTLSDNNSTGNDIYVGTLTINSGGTFTNSGTAEIRGGITMNGSAFNSGTGIYTFSTNSQNISGSTAFTIAKITSNVALTNQSTAGLTISTALAGSGSLTQGTNAIVKLGMTDANLTISSIDSSSNSGNTVWYSLTTGNQTVKGQTYQNLTIAKGLATRIATLGGNTTVNGNLVVSGGTLQLSTYNFTVNGTTTVTRTLADNSATGTDLFVGAVAINTAGIWTDSANSAYEFRGGLSCNGCTTFTSGTGVYTFGTNDQSVTGISLDTMTITGVTATITSGGSLTVTTALNGTGTIKNDTSATLTLGGSLTVTTVDFSAADSLVVYAGTADQTVRSATYNYLEINNPGFTATLGGNITVGEASGYPLIIDANSTLDVSTSNYTIYLNANFDNSSGTGTFVARQGKVVMGGKSSANYQHLAGDMTGSNAFYDLTITNTYGTYVSSCSGSNVAGIAVDNSITVTHNFDIITPGVKVAFASGISVTSANINWSGSSGSPILLYGGGAGWALDVTGTQTAVSYVEVNYSDATTSASPIVASNSTDCLNNTNWTFATGPSITGPANVQMPDYTIGSGGYTERNFYDVSGLVQVTAASGFTVTISSANLTSAHNTVTNSNVKLKTDGTVGSDPTKILNCSGFSGITETATGEYGLNTSQTIVTTSSGAGTCDIYPTVRVYLTDLNLYAEQVTGTITITVTSP